ncbi:putative phytochrome-like histidine kinase [Rhizoctonia solani 123E]|uniref:Putative phytochrome-like histidine kinase n=1 Tax=Rhizoctonia solani 123E TaxID=1423351 RepID=A0A074SD36_9AGAM|nr:putative phytochrome-like histidine kinase [Rhizoctonia solani 123E]
MSDKPPPSPPILQPTASYIYPVRSLLSGIQPAPETEAATPEPAILLDELRKNAQLQQSPPQPSLGIRRGLGQPTLPIQRGNVPRDESFFSAPLPTKPESASPTFFTAQSQSGSPLSRKETIDEGKGLEHKAPSDMRPYPADGVDGIVRLAHLGPSEETSGAGGDTDGVILHDSVDGEVVRRSVHKGSQASTSGTPAGTGTGTTESGVGESQNGSSVSRPSARRLAPPPPQRSQSQSQQGQVAVRTDTDSRAVSTSGLSEESQELVTVRFQHVEDEDGHHVVVGREGRLTRCEDEPIRVPGAVQGFGVLIAVEEDFETGNLVVRQVSENSGELLGLSPKYLFSLDCFTQILPDSQADILWDNVQFLHDPELDASDATEDSPQVFLLSGWGEPGTALHDMTFGNTSSGRREWTCWCAAHRPRQPRKQRDPEGEGSSSGSQLDPNKFDEEDEEVLSPLIVLEFELERDIFNPLYPPYTPAIALDSPGVPSRSSGSTTTSGRKSTSTGRSGSGTQSAGTPSAGTGSAETGSAGAQTVMSSGTEGSTLTEQGKASHDQDGTPNTRCIPTGTGDDAIIGTSPEQGRTREVVGEGLTKGEVVVPVVVGKSDDPPQDAPINTDETTPTAVPTSSPAPLEGQVESAGTNSGQGTGESSVTVVDQTRGSGGGLQGTVTDPSSSDPASTSAVVERGQELDATEMRGLIGDDQWFPSPEDVVESTTSRSRPLRALERMRRVTRDGHGPRRSGPGTGGVGTMDVFAVLAQVNDQLGSAPDLESFLKVVVGVIKDLTQFHRVLVYQFDEQWNGQVVAELVDWSQTHDIYKGLHFPAGDIPAQARELYTINKVRLLYDRGQTTARIVVRDRSDLESPLDMTHSCLRAMSPIHIKYLGNMGVRASMSISILTFGQLWGLIACHSYGPHGMRVSFPVRQMLRLLSDSISRNIERLSYAQRLHTRKLISTVPTEQHPTGYIVSNAEDLISLFDADFGVLVIGEGAKILGPNEHGQETLLVAEYLRLKQFNLMQVSQAVKADFPDLKLPTGLDVVAGLLYVPLSPGGKDFIALMRKGQLRDVHWAGKPFKAGVGSQGFLEPRTSFKVWKETVSGRCRAWTDEQLETAGVLALVYGKFIEVWRQKETALKTNQLTNLLLSNASHEVRTPLNHIINYLEMALNGPLDSETRDNLVRSHTASRSLLFTINDLLDLTKHETGNETSFNEPFDLPGTIEDAVTLYRIEAMRRRIQFVVDTTDCPQMVTGDSKKIRTVVSNLTANAVKYTESGQISVECRRFKEPIGLRDSKEVAVEIVVADTGCGISSAKLESIFREFEQVESSRSGESQGLGLGLAVVARIVEQLGGQLRVDSKQGQGSRFSFLIPFALPDGSSSEQSYTPESGGRPQRSRKNSIGSAYASAASASAHSANSRIEDLVGALSAPPGQMSSSSSRGGARPSPPAMQRRQSTQNPPVARVSTRSTNPPPGVFPVESSKWPVRGVRIDEFDMDKPSVSGSQAPVLEQAANRAQKQLEEHTVNVGAGKRGGKKPPPEGVTRLRILVVEDDDTNRKILCKRLALDGHEVQHTTNGQEAVQKVENDREWDCVLMDIQMPILDGFGATKAIRKLEAVTYAETSIILADRTSMRLNGRIPIFAVSASLREKQREEMHDLGMDGWILKPIGFDRLRTIMKGITDLEQRQKDKYQPGKWEVGGWLGEPNPILRVSHN